MSSGARRVLSGLRSGIRSTIRVRQENIVVRRRKACAQLFLLFQGVRDGLLMDPTQFLAETDLLSRNLVLLRDPHRAFYQRGVSPMLRDFDGLIEWLAELRDQQPGVAELYCVGTSMGAFAAAAAGARLGADAVYAFGLMTDLTDTRIAERGNLADALRSEGADVDLRDLLATHNGVTEYRVYYAEGNDEDRLRAQRIADLPGVRLVPTPGKSHNTVGALRRRGGLGSLFPAYRGVTSAS